MIALNLATVLAERGDHRSALDVLGDELAHNDPTMRVERLRAFLAQMLEDFPAAIAGYQRVVAAFPSDWESWNNLGNARRLAGEFEQAVVALSRAAELNPGSPPVRLNLALALGSAAQFQEAEQQLRQMAEDFPGDPYPLRELHALLKEQGREEEALEAIEAASARAPSDVDLLLGVASQRLLLLQGPGAEAAYRQVIAQEPANSLANVGLAVCFELTNQTEALSQLVGEAQARGVSKDTLNFIRAFDHRRARRFAEGLAALEQVPEDLETARRHHLLGQLQEGLGNYDEAFGSFLRMNEIQRADPSRPEERAAKYRNAIRSNRETVTPKWARAWRSAAADARRASPVFLVGFPRSGTTLLDTMLMGHPRIEVLEEEPALLQASARLPELSALPNASDEQITAARDLYFKTVGSLTSLEPGNLLIDKNPLTMNQLPIARRIFPDTRIILAMRHPCDVVLSCFITNFRLNAGMANFLRLETAAELYDLSFGYFEQVRKTLKLPVHTVTYEKLVADREGELHSLFDFLSLDWSDEVLDHQATAKSRGRIKTASYAQVVEPIYSRSAGRWKNYRKHLEPVLPVLEPWARKFGYDL